MLTCLPQGICSWNYQICDGKVIATLETQYFGEQASLGYKNEPYDVTKDGYLSGHWNLVRAGKRIAQASKPNPLAYSFDVFDDDIRFILRSSSVFTREFEIVLESSVVGTIVPAHPLTRRAFIECGSVVSIPLQLFSFCLVIFMWRRKASDSSPA